MEARAVAPPPAPVAEAEDVVVVDATERAVVRRAPSRTRERERGRQRPVARPVALTRDEEYRYIRDDLYRLLITAGALVVVMLVLLVVVE
jgi:hypothetical protein